MISAQPRNLFGTLKSKALRKNALIPSTIYSKDGTVVHIALSEKEFTKLIQGYKFLNTKLELSLEGKMFTVLPRTIDFHPITERILHIEFKEVQNMKNWYTGSRLSSGVSRLSVNKRVTVVPSSMSSRYCITR